MSTANKTSACPAPLTVLLMFSRCAGIGMAAGLAVSLMLIVIVLVLSSFTSSPVGQRVELPVLTPLASPVSLQAE
jgi:hypothetical protein